MAKPAHITSVEALELFRAALINYSSKARPTLEEVSSDVMRTRLWLENEQRDHWELQLKKRRLKLEELRNAQFSARLMELPESVAAVHRAKRACEEAETKLRAIKHWTRQYESVMHPLVKQMEKLQTMLAHDVPQAVAYLTETIKILQDYAGMAIPGASASSPPAPDGATGEAGAAPSPESAGTEGVP